MMPPLTPTDKRHETGAFDIIGDVHGCFDELQSLLMALGYQLPKKADDTLTHPQNRRLIFVGDLVDRGERSPEVLRLVMDAADAGIALCVNGNHDDRLRRYLKGNNVTIAHGLQETIDQLNVESDAFRQRVYDFLSNLPSHYWLDGGKLAVVHAGIKQEQLGQESASIRRLCMYGETTGEIDEHGFPERLPWANEYGGDTMIIYGHTPIDTPEWVNNTLNIDTGCVFGGKLTALRYPEKELVSVSANRTYAIRKSNR